MVPGSPWRQTPQWAVSVSAFSLCGLNAWANVASKQIENVLAMVSWMASDLLIMAKRSRENVRVLTTTPHALMRDKRGARIAASTRVCT